MWMMMMVVVVLRVNGNGNGNDEWTLGDPAGREKRTLKRPFSRSSLVISQSFDPFFAWTFGTRLPFRPPNFSLQSRS